MNNKEKISDKDWAEACERKAATKAMEGLIALGLMGAAIAFSACSKDQAPEAPAPAPTHSIMRSL